MKKWRDYFLFIWERFKVGVKMKPVTLEYPYVVRQTPLLAHVSLKNDFRECIVCYDCQKQCPVKAIQIQSHEFAPNTLPPLTSKGVASQHEMDSFKIDYSKCTMCGLCVQICPTQSITFDREFVQPKLEQHELLTDLVHIPRTMRRGPSIEN